MVRDCPVLPKRKYEDLESSHVVSVVTLEPSMLVYQRGYTPSARGNATRPSQLPRFNSDQRKPDCLPSKEANDSSTCFESRHDSNKINPYNACDSKKSAPPIKIFTPTRRMGTFNFFTSSIPKDSNVPTTCCYGMFWVAGRLPVFLNCAYAGDPLEEDKSRSFSFEALIRQVNWKPRSPRARNELPETRSPTPCDF